jgi:hypothetical protein
MKINFTTRFFIIAASIYCAANSVLAQSISAPWAATVKASFNKIDETATYTFTFTNVSGVPNAYPPKLGYRCSFFNLPVMQRNYRDQPFWSIYNNTDAEKSQYDCEVMFGRRISSKNGDPNWATPDLDSASKQGGDPMSGTWHLLDPKGYTTSNGWRVEEVHPCGEDTCGTSLYYLKFLPKTISEEVYAPVPAGQSFVFSVKLSDKDPNYLLSNYLIENGQYRAYPITKADTTPPVITAKLDILPAKAGDNKDFVRVQLTASAKDNFDAGPEWSVSSVLRTDKPTVAGDVARNADMVENQWLLKVPVGETRKYVVNVSAQDATGNVGTQAVPIELTGKPIVLNPPPPKPRTICLFGNRFCFTLPFGFW